MFLLGTIAMKANSQVYYGKNGFGKFEFINDSVCTVSFTDIPGWPRLHITDTCSFIQKNDTIFISTKVKNRFEVTIRDSVPKVNGCKQILLKVYEKRNNNFTLTSEYLDGIQLDTLLN